LKALLVCGGEAPPFSIIAERLHEFSFFCAADSGLDTLSSWGLKADLCVGDMDSLVNKQLLEGCAEIMQFPHNKDYTDTEIGLLELKKRGFSTIVLAGGGGGRLDHILAIRALFEQDNGLTEWYTAREHCIKISGTQELHCKPGSTLSVFPLGRAEGMSAEGLQWQLEGLKTGQISISNRSISDTIRINSGKNPILLIIGNPFDY
jgi:thiamine pyrophosphokinase